MAFEFKTRPFAHQRECFDLAKERPYYALFLEMGLGKTKITLDIIEYRKIIRPGYKTLVVCPNTLIDNWEEEAKIHSTLTCVTLTGSKQRRIKRLFENDADVYVINYEGVRILREELSKKTFNLLVLDESQKVKNPGSQQSKACYALSTNIKHKLILTGTPIMNHPLEVFGQYKILTDKVFGTNFYRFRARYAIMGGYLNKQAIQWINIKEFKNKMFSCAVRKTKKECLDLPEKLYEVVKLELPPEQRAVYKELKETFISEFKENPIIAPIVITRLMRFSQITAGFIKDVEGEIHEFKTNPKVEWLIEFLKENDSKVVVFCKFHKEIDMLCEALTKANIGHVSIDGRVKKRIELVKKFNDDVDVRVFVGEIHTSGVGINLTSASYAVFFSNDYSYGVRVQAEDRIHRIGQDKNCTYIDLVARATVDITIANTLKRKGSISYAIIDANNIQDMLEGAKR